MVDSSPRLATGPRFSYPGGCLNLRLKNAGAGKTPVPRLSIVIPCIQEAGSFEATLASVLQNRPDDCEVLVVQPRNYDDPYELKDDVRFVQAPADATLIDLINVGVEKATGEIVHLLSCEVEVDEGWAQPALKHFNDPLIGCVSPLVVFKGDSAQIVSRGVHYGPGGTRRVRRSAAKRRDRWRHVVAPTLSAGMYRRQALLGVGGFCGDVGADFSDVDLGLMFHASGYRCLHEEDCVVTTECPTSVTPLSYANGRGAERLFWRNVGPSGWTCILVAHPFTWLAEGICNLHRPQIVSQMMGRVRAWLERSSHRRHQRHLRTLQANHDSKRPSPSDNKAAPPDAPTDPQCSSALKSRAAA